MTLQTSITKIEQKLTFTSLKISDLKNPTFLLMEFVKMAYQISIKISKFRAFFLRYANFYVKKLRKSSVKITRFHWLRISRDSCPTSSVLHHYPDSCRNNFWWVANESCWVQKMLGVCTHQKTPANETCNIFKFYAVVVYHLCNGFLYLKPMIGGRGIWFDHKSQYLKAMLDDRGIWLITSHR